MFSGVIILDFPLDFFSEKYGILSPGPGNYVMYTLPEIQLAMNIAFQKKNLSIIKTVKQHTVKTFIFTTL